MYGVYVDDSSLKQCRFRVPLWFIITQFWMLILAYIVSLLIIAIIVLEDTKENKTNGEGTTW